MDFSQVKSITIPEGEVKKIEIGGTTVWEKEHSWGIVSYTSGETPRTYTIKSESDFNVLCNSVVTQYVFSDGTSINKSSVTGFAFGERFPTSIGDGFLQGCVNLNSVISVPSGVTSIGDDFLQGCNSLNSAVNLNSSITSIGDNFMRGCSAFAPTVFSVPFRLTSIGNYFMAYCTSLFTISLFVPTTVTSIGDHFLYCCDNLTHLTVDSDVSPTDIYSLSTNNQSAEMYTYGIWISGLNVAGWKSSLPNRSSTARPYPDPPPDTYRCRRPREERSLYRHVIL